MDRQRRAPLRSGGREQSLSLLPAQHRRYPLRLLGARHIGQPRKILGEHLLVKKQNRGQRKILRVRRNVSIRRQTRKESLGLSTPKQRWVRSEEHTSELQSLMRISYAVFCLKKKK